MPGLNAAATSDEIRLAYRDLVNVWHPDRFGADARLRAKAEEHLKSINAAYHALESSNFRTDEPMSAPKPESTWQSQVASQPKASRKHIPREWVYVASIFLIVAIAGFVLRALGSRQSASATPAVQQPSATGEPIPAKVSHRASHSAAPAMAAPSGFQVWTLSQADTNRVQLACASHPLQSDTYRGCMKAQLDVVRRPHGTPDMTGLSRAERQAAEDACASARDLSGDSAYDLCLRQQVAAVAAEPIRPDLSTFGTADRNSISAACSAVSKRGAAEYDRCLVRFAKTLSDAQPSADAH